MTGGVCTRARMVARLAVAAGVFVGLVPVDAAAQGDIILHTNSASLHGAWQRVADAAAASGTRVWNPDRGAAKLTTASATPADYVELQFKAERERGYRLWVRGRADNDSWANDSVYVQFSDSLNAAGSPAFRIGSADATIVSVEEGSARGLAGWGWQDNGWETLGPLVYFPTTGTRTIRIQRREDGISIDQVVLSPAAYLTTSPGAGKSDRTILAENTGVSDTREIVIAAAQPSSLAGTWRVADNATAARGKVVGTSDAATPKASSAAAVPTSYADFTFHADAGRTYRLWVRGRAEADYWGNDSAFVQFSGARALDGTPVARIGTTGAFIVNLEDASGAGLQGWGWQDHGYGAGVLGPVVTFAQSGTQTIRLQTREDGFWIDQIVLSSERYLSAAPGPLKNDGLILETSTTNAPAPATVAGTTTTSTGATSVGTTTPTASPAPGAPVRLRMLEWNLHHGVGTDGIYDIERIADWMVRMNPDVILLNEVEKFTGWGNEDQPARYRSMLESKTGKRWYSHYINEYGNWSGHGKGHQILSTCELTATAQTVISYERVAGQATISVNGRALNLFVTHLDPYDQAIRLGQAREVLRWAAGFAENRVLVGDMNAWPDQSSIAEFGVSYADAWTTAENLGTAIGVAGITPFGATKKGRIDYVFVSRGAPQLAVIDSTVVDTRDAAGHMPSDHRPVLVTLEVR